MHRIGVLQGNYLGIYVASRCAYWNLSNACKFCTTGKNVGAAEEWKKSVEDVVEVARAARDESGAIFTPQHRLSLRGACRAAIDAWFAAVCTVRILSR